MKINREMFLGVTKLLEVPPDLDAHKVAVLLADLWSKLEAADADASKFEELRRKKRQAAEEAKKKQDELDDLLRKAQAFCPHPVVKYHPDASGNNDSHYECELCGAEVPRPKDEKKKDQFVVRYLHDDRGSSVYSGHTLYVHHEAGVTGEIAKARRFDNLAEAKAYAEGHRSSPSLREWRAPQVVRLAADGVPEAVVFDAALEPVAPAKPAVTQEPLGYAVRYPNLPNYKGTDLYLDLFNKPGPFDGVMVWATRDSAVSLLQKYPGPPDEGHGLAEVVEIFSENVSGKRPGSVVGRACPPPPPPLGFVVCYPATPGCRGLSVFLGISGGMVYTWSLARRFPDAASAVAYADAHPTFGPGHGSAQVVRLSCNSSGLFLNDVVHTAKKGS